MFYFFLVHFYRQVLVSVMDDTSCLSSRRIVVRSSATKEHFRNEKSQTICNVLLHIFFSTYDISKVVVYIVMYTRHQLNNYY